jgi:hypothetical protein
MKKEFAVSITVNDSHFNGQITLEHYSFLLEAENGTLFHNGTKMKACNVEVDLPFDSVDELLEQASEKLKAAQLSEIERKERELAAMKAAFEKEETKAA